MSDMTTTFTAKGAELLSHARELVPTFRKRAAEAEKLRCIPPESIDDLRKAGLFRTLQPAVLGGYELPLDEAVLITATVAEGCGSTGWVQGVYSDHCATLGMFDGQAQKDVLGRIARQFDLLRFYAHRESRPGRRRVPAEWAVVVFQRLRLRRLGVGP